MVARQVAKRYGEQGILSISVNPGQHISAARGSSYPLSSICPLTYIVLQETSRQTSSVTYQESRERSWYVVPHIVSYPLYPCL